MVRAAQKASAAWGPCISGRNCGSVCATIDSILKRGRHKRALACRHRVSRRALRNGRRWQGKGDELGQQQESRRPGRGWPVVASIRRCGTPGRYGSRFLGNAGAHRRYFLGPLSGVAHAREATARAECACASAGARRRRSAVGPGSQRNGATQDADDRSLNQSFSNPVTNNPREFIAARSMPSELNGIAMRPSRPTAITPPDPPMRTSCCITTSSAACTTSSSL